MTLTNTLPRYSGFRPQKVIKGFKIYYEVNGTPKGTSLPLTMSFDIFCRKICSGCRL